MSNEKYLEAVSYVKIVLSTVETSLNKEALKKLQEEILLQSQGEAVEFDENSDIAALMAAFDTVHGVSPEAVLKVDGHGRFLIFEHREKPVLRSNDILADFSNEKIKAKTGKLEKITEINIEEIWNGESEEKDYLKRIKKCLNKIKKEIVPAEAGVLIGSGPAILFLIAEHLLYGIAGEVWHQLNSKSEAVKIR